MTRFGSGVAAVALLCLCCLSCDGSAARQAQDTKESAMGTQEAEKKVFAPHPGKIMFWTMWNHTVKVEQADGVPDANKFVYYDADHNETHDAANAATRVPILKVEMRSYDADGHLVEPSKAVRISIAEFGAHDQELRHSSGPGPVRR